MLYLIIGILLFIGGSIVGAVLMSIMAAASKDSRERENIEIKEKENFEIKETKLIANRFIVRSKDICLISDDDILNEHIIKSQIYDYLIKNLFDTNLIQYNTEYDYYYVEFWTKDERENRNENN